ncbi:MAG: glycosyltransferase family 39 protein, partial [Nanoarchaeota archaeon]|nr:glycosyltransferase family 39 protein [Nanoarchaeota archaeon]
AFFLRVFRLGQPSLWVDEATSTIASKMILLKGLPIFDSGLLYSRAYLFHYLQSFFLLFGETDFLVRFASVIIGLATIVLAYFIGKEYSKSGGLISALFMSVFYLEVFYSRQARFYQLFQLMFFLSLYLLYKSKKNPKFLYASLVALFITINTQIAGLVLAPFFIIHILIYSKKWRKYLSVIPAIPLIQKFSPAKGLSADSTSSAINYASRYASYTHNLIYMIVLFVPGVIWSFFKKKRLTLLIILPSSVLLIGIFSLKTFAFRYAYFAVFPLILYFSLFLSFLYEKYGKIILIVIAVLLIFPSNLLFPYTSVNILKPIDYSLHDSSAPTTNYKNLPPELLANLENSENTLISYFSSDVEWNIRRPDYVLPFSMNGMGYDHISYNNSKGDVVDRYSGALMLDSIPERPYYLVADRFSTSKLKPDQRELLGNLTEECDVSYENFDLRVYFCF